MRAAIAIFVKFAALVLSLSFVGLPALAQTRPPNLQPVPEPPPPPKGYELDSAMEPQITIVKRGTETVEEYRMGGKLYMMKVTPAGGGTPYYLVDNNGDGTFARQNGHDTGVRPPMWVIHSF
ncbi:MAG TPA: DUF2782 domain-containing protein [Burkholderiales bacterium]|nr:DUF2782 domain-containing protein [Burkholderiales bacterium]